MAVLYVSEYADLPITIQGKQANVVLEPPLAEQVVAIGGTSTQCTNAFKTNTNFVRIHTDAICSILFGTNPTATATMKRLAANQTEYFGVTPPPTSTGVQPTTYKVAVITNT